MLVDDLKCFFKQLLRATERWSRRLSAVLRIGCRHLQTPRAWDAGRTVRDIRTSVYGALVITSERYRSSTSIALAVSLRNTERWSVG
jgi:hypothetical protein